MPDVNSQELLDQFLAGKGEAAAALFDRYFERLLALARTRIGSKLRRRIDPEDVVQSAYRSFFVHAQDREYRLDRSGDLWRLLACMTLNKLYGQIERQTATKRSVHREVDEEVVLAELASREPTVADVVAVAEQLNLILLDLSSDERFALTATLAGQQPDEIARAIGKSPRTVRRLVAQARSEFERRLLDRRPSLKDRRSSPRSMSSEPIATLQFADYRLEKLIGAGGMGKVYRATDKRAGKTVAIKSLHKARQHDDREVDRFVQESRILSELRHPNLVRVAGLGQFPAGGYFLVMDYVEGGDLQVRLKLGPLPLAEAVSILRQVGLAVQHAHEKGIIHCDLKPANVLIGNDGRVLVTDFGFAHILSDTSAAHPDATGGTLGFMAPEMLQLGCEPTPAADIFALGAMLWTLVTGRVPMSVDEVRAEHRDSKAIEAICRRCLASEPADRFATVSELMDALDSIGTK